MNRRKMKEIAEAWINYSISPEIQRQYVRDIAQFPVNPAAALLSPEESETFHVNDPS